MNPLNDYEEALAEMHQLCDIGCGYDGCLPGTNCPCGGRKLVEWSGLHAHQSCIEFAMECERQLVLTSELLGLADSAVVPLTDGGE